MALWYELAATSERGTRSHQLRPARPRLASQCAATRSARSSVASRRAQPFSSSMSIPLISASSNRSSAAASYLCSAAAHDPLTPPAKSKLTSSRTALLTRGRGRGAGAALGVRVCA
eukprot:4157140-Prymnesium_polylepis.1